MGHGAHLLLGISGQRHQGAGQLFLCQAVEHIRLVLLRVDGGLYRIAAVGHLYHTGVMTGGNEICLQYLHEIEHTLPFHVPVAADAGIGGPPCQILPYEGICHILFKCPETVERIIRDPQAHGHPAGIVDLTAPALGAVVRLPGAKSHTDDLMALLFQKPGCHGTVYAAGHAVEDFCHPLSPP